ncbi:condensation domain-containing protein [Amycolatopsis kentuckyensis]|uniref:condensation domain-containing protein n=1 Tax=Amycolatopsis kentuckyensis TaxID=218823 RepID=UPI0013027520|nr:condensation domain-containing protein [Amycolatopsis kentuckyensis]
MREIREQGRIPASSSIASADRPTAGSGPGEAPLSAAQRRLWLVDQAAPGAATYNVPVFLRWHGRVDVPALRAALTEVVRRHEVLRTRYHLRDGDPVQQVVPAAPVEVEVVATEDARESASHRVALPFDLAAGPVLRATVFHGAEDAVLLVLHHIAFDGWSLGRLGTDLALAYDAAVHGRPVRLPGLAEQYAGFARRDAAEAGSAETADRIRQRLAELAGVPAGLTLAGALPRGPGRRVVRDGAEQVAVLSPALWQAVADYARAHRLTPFVVLFSAFQLLLRLRSARPEFLAAAITANRSSVEVEDLVGFFVNTVPLRCAVPDGADFTELCRRVRGEAYRALTHQRIPFDRLTAAARTELVDVAFALQNFPRPAADVPVRWDQPEILPTGTAKFDLLLTVEPRGAGARASLEHDTGRYPADVASALLESYVDILTLVLADPAAELSRFAAEPAAEAPAPAEEPAATALSGTQHRAAELFAAALGEAGTEVGELGPRADFFALGGHSLLVVRMLRRIEDETGVALSARRFLADPTVAGLAALLAEPAPAAAEPAPAEPGPERPATAAQQRFWSLDRLPWLRQAYVVPAVVELPAGTDPDRLRDVTAEVLAQHGAFRSVFRLDRKRRRVVVRAGEAVPPVTVTDARAWDRARLADHLAEACWAGFDLAAGPLARAEVVRHRDGVLLVVVAHHIVCDGPSMDLVLRQIGGEPVAAATPSSPGEEEGADRDTEAVIARLSGAPVDVVLPHDRPRPPEQSTEALVVRASLGPERAAALRATATAAGCTPFMLGAALLGVALARTGPQRDFLFAFPWSTRSARDSGAVGMFVDTLLLRVDLRDGPSWTELLGRVRAASQAAFGTSLARFDAVAAALDPGRDTSRPPLTPVYLTVRDTPPPGRLRPLEPLHIKYELELTVVDDAAGLGFELAGLTALFDRGTAETLLAAIVTAAEDLSTGPSARPLEEM